MESVYSLLIRLPSRFNDRKDSIWTGGSQEEFLFPGE